MELKEFDYELPKELIAQEPLGKRDRSRLMVLDRETHSITEKTFRDITGHIAPGDCLVLNDTKVLPVRLFGKRKTGAKVEIFLLDTKGEKLRALVRPSKRIKQNEEIELESGIKAVVHGEADVGRFVSFDSDIEEVLDSGHIPLPPYITRKDSLRDREDYQTVYASKEGATASPTAGLHFTGEILEELASKGVSIVHVTLHTSYGTFSPVKARNVEDHRMHSEYFEIGDDAAETVNRTKSDGGRVFAVGTTSTRVLESASSSGEGVRPEKGATNLFIYPGYEFKIVDGLITNFHLPESTLLMLVSAFAGKDFVLEAYSRAVESKFRFFSYGDAMLII
ncbi:MAG: tRNA preQ1(34) S-adenosylmethionine ribosyltransferase-isomerase QueA [Candidatus Omnitrophica bacterium]|nr:tRNA preQ1(34) S-adenosylmethionine ribosyltransferase-isomerase QueA [Candidatus Omnitrophota bacterium]